VGDSTQESAGKPANEGEVIPDVTAKNQAMYGMSCLSRKVDLEASARYSGALTRKRNIQSAENLLKLVMVYALTDCSLRMVGLWGTVMGWGSLCKNGVRQRIRQCQGWIGMMIVSVLSASKLSQPKSGGLRLRLFDASTVSQPGSHQADWRLHLGFDLSRGRMTDIQLTDSKQGETLTRWQFQPDEICLADRYSGNPRSLGVLLGAAAWFVIRIGWQNLPVQDRAGRPFDLSQWLTVQSNDPAGSPAQAAVWVPTPQGRFPVRVIARAIPPDKADKNRQKLLAEAKRKKKRPDQRSLLAAGFVMVVSNLPELTWGAANILELYRFRWQIELVFKRLKSLLKFDQLRSTDPSLTQVYLLTKLLVALLLTEAEWSLILSSPDSFHDPERPLSLWRFTQLTLEAFRSAVCGFLTWDRILQHLPTLRRYLCDEPRKRQSQLVAFRNLAMSYGS
jgi:hypothetical protein